MENNAGELDRKAKQLSSIIKLNNIIGFLPLDLKEILHAVSNEVNKLFSPFKCCFELLPLEWARDSTTSGQLSFHNCTNLCCSAKECTALRDQLPVIVADAREGIGCRNRVDRGETCSYICVPIVAGKELLGNMCLNSTVTKVLIRDELEVLLSIANQTAFAIQRARLFNKLGEEKDSLANAYQEINQLNSQLKEMVWELQSTQARLIKSERLAATGHMAANLAHEINNPTGIIISRLEWLLLEADELALSPQTVEDLKVLMKHSQRIAKTTRGLLSFARRSAEEMELIDLNEIIRESVNWLENQYVKAGISCVLDLQELLPVRGNRERLQQVLVNLLANAKDAMPDGGKVSITTKIANDGKWIILHISDTGSGIAPEFQNKLFEPFFTTKEIGQGTGLGLAIVYGIIKEHGGEIEVTSEPGQGAAFTISLPVQAEASNVPTIPEENG